MQRLVSWGRPVTKPGNPACARQDRQGCRPNQTVSTAKCSSPPSHQTLRRLPAEECSASDTSALLVGFPGTWDLDAQTCRRLEPPPDLPRLPPDCGVGYQSNVQAIHACQDAGDLTRSRGKFDESASQRLSSGQALGPEPSAATWFNPHPNRTKMRVERHKKECTIG